MHIGKPLAGLLKPAGIPGEFRVQYSKLPFPVTFFFRTFVLLTYGAEHAENINSM